MNFVRNSWNKNDYDEFIRYLFSIRDIKYRDFHSKLGVGGEVIGVRTPILKRIAKDISKGNYRDFFNLFQNNYYEEVTIYGFIICNIDDFNDSILYLNRFKYYINNWASCDLFCAGYKTVLEHKEYFWKYINDNIISDNLWIRRLCFVLLLSYYIEDNYLEDIFKLCDKYNTSDYYVQMAVAWLISLCYVKYSDSTILYIKNNKLDKFTHNMALQKIRDSYRVSDEDKKYLSSLKRK